MVPASVVFGLQPKYRCTLSFIMVPAFVAFERMKTEIGHDLETCRKSALLSIQSSVRHVHVCVVWARPLQCLKSLHNIFHLHTSLLRFSRLVYFEHMSVFSASRFIQNNMREAMYFVLQPPKLYNLLFCSFLKDTLLCLLRRFCNVLARIYVSLYFQNIVETFYIFPSSLGGEFCDSNPRAMVRCLCGHCRSSIR
jgi:hypothetical protein